MTRNRRRRALYRAAIAAQDVELLRVAYAVAYHARKGTPLPDVFSAWALRSTNTRTLLQQRRDREGLTP